MGRIRFCFSSQDWQYFRAYFNTYHPYFVQKTPQKLDKVLCKSNGPHKIPLYINKYLDLKIHPRKFAYTLLIILKQFTNESYNPNLKYLFEK